MTSRLKGSCLSDRPSNQVRAKLVCFKSRTTLSPDQWLLSHQDPVLGLYLSLSTANRWPHWWGGLSPLQRCSRRILQLQPTEQWQWRNTPHSPSLQRWSFAIRCFNIISRTLFEWGFLLFCRKQLAYSKTPVDWAKGSFAGIDLNCSKYCYVSLTIQFKISNLFAHS